MRLPSFLLLSLLLLLTGCISLAEDVTPPPGFVAPTPAPALAANSFPASAPDVDSGAAIYAEKCAPCHGNTGRGDGSQASALPVTVPPLGRADFAFDKSPARWYGVVTQGNLQNFMPGFASLSDQQRWDVVAYALSLSASAEQVQAGKALYEVNCAECHGLDGRKLPNASLADQGRMAALSNQDIAVLSQKGIPPAMPAANLSDVDAANLAAYARTFTFASSGKVAAAPASTPQPDFETPESLSTESAAPSPDAQRGTISGIITNGSGGDVPAGLKVTLHTFIHDLATQQFTEGETRETDVLAQGTYRFDGVPLSPGDAYYVSVEYGGVTYESQAAIPARDGLSEYNLPITIYETTTDTSDLAISTAHILLDYSQPGLIQVVEFFVFANMGDKTIIAAEAGQPVIEIPLPQGYQNLQFENGVLGGRFSQTATGFGDTLPIPPTGSQGQHSIVFAFDMPYSTDPWPLAGLFGGPKFELTQTFNIKTGALNLLVPQGVKVQGQNLVDGGTQSMGGGFTFQLYRAGSLEAGQTFTAKVSGAPATTAATTSPSGDSNRSLIVGMGAFGAVLILAGVFLYWRDRQKEEDEDALGEEDDEDEEEMSQDDILDAIIALDDQFRAGNLSEEAYQERRAKLKAMLRKS
jgi:mono/diheme cytochrome c family protein